MHIADYQIEYKYMGGTVNEKDSALQCGLGKAKVAY